MPRTSGSPQHNSKKRNMERKVDFGFRNPPPTPKDQQRWCESLTKAGVPCPQRAPRVEIRGKRYQLKTCVMHAPKAIRDELGVGAPGKGRKPVASAADILRERFEADTRRYLQPIEDALEAMRAVVVGNGASAHIEMVEDLTTRLKAAEMMLDRVYGRARQSVEHTGAGGEAIEVSVPSDQKRVQDVAAVLAEVGALGNVIPANGSAQAPNSN